MSALAREAKELQGRTGGAHKKEEKPAPPSANGELTGSREWIHKKQNPEANLFSSIGLASVILFKNPRFFPMLLTNAGQKSKNFGLANFFIKVSKYKGSKK